MVMDAVVFFLLKLLCFPNLVQQQRILLKNAVISKCLKSLTELKDT